MAAPATAPAAPTSSDDLATCKPSQLSDRDLVVLESTLRVQLQVSKHVRVAQVTSAMGVAAFSGPLAALPSGVSIATSQLQRRKLKRRHRHVTREMTTRGVSTENVGDTRALGKKALAISAATGLACCLLTCSADLLIDRAVVQVVSEVLVGHADALTMDALAGHIATRLATEAAAAPSSPSAQEQATSHQQQSQSLKATRSWGGFTSKWKSARAKKEMAKKTESLPPDLFGEREVLADNAIPPLVEVHRSSEYAAYGECVVLRFATITPGDDVDIEDDAGTKREAVAGQRAGRTTIVGERDALSEQRWQALWTLEDGPIDVPNEFEEGDDGDDDELHDLFGVGASVHDYDLFGASTGTSVHGTTADFDLFGANGAKS